MNNYILIPWPESQAFMEEEWFEEEALLADEKVGSSAYFIPENRVINNEYILQQVEKLASLLESTKDEDKYIDEEWSSGLPFEGGMNTFESVLNIKLSL